MSSASSTSRITESMPAFLKLDRPQQVITVVLLGIAARIHIFHEVAVNGDTGLYLYDAKQLLWGKQMFVEFPSRSPLMEHLLAAAVAVGESPLVSARSLMLVISTLLGVAIYVLGRQLHSHAVGLLAMCLFYFSPFSLVWGLWVKTEQVAGLFLVTAFIVAIHYIDLDELPLHAPAIIGTLFGMAFLVRRVAIVHIAAFAIFVLWYRYRVHGKFWSTLKSAGVTLMTAASILVVAYTLLSRGNLSLMIDITYQHAIALVTSSGNGSLGWIDINSVSPATGTAEIPGWLRMFCRKCGLNTAQVFTRTILVTLPVLLLLLPFLRSYATKASDFIEKNALPTLIVVLSLLVVWKVPYGTYPDRVVAAIIFGAAVAVVWLVEPLDWGEFWKPKYGLLVIVLAGLTAGYLYRDRILYVTYFQDFYPYLVLLASITAVAFYQRHSDKFTWRSSLTAAAVVLLVISTAVAGANVYPYKPNDVPEDSDWFSVDLAQQYGADIEERVEGDKPVFTAQPLYVIESDLRIAEDISRKYYVFEGWPDSPVRDRIARNLESKLASGAVFWAVIDDEASELFRDEGVLSTFQENYCPVESPLYDETGGHLYRYTGDTSGCESYEP